MKKRTVILTAALLSLSLLSCGRKPAEFSASSGVGRVPSAASEPEKELISYPYQVSRTDSILEREMSYPSIVVLRTRAELEQYTHLTEGYYDYNDTFYDIATEYDAYYFENRCLIMALLESPSGSYRYHFDGFAETELGYSMEIEEQTHNSDTDDMALWHVIVEVPKDSLVLECSDQITVRITRVVVE